MDASNTEAANAIMQASFFMFRLHLLSMTLRVTRMVIGKMTVSRSVEWLRSGAELKKREAAVRAQHF